MRRILLLIALGACSHATAGGPAWPKDRTTADHDGGESLAPHESKQIAVAVEASDEEVKPVAKPAAAAPAAVVPEAAAPAVVAPPTGPAEEPITTEEIVIEVDD